MGIVPGCLGRERSRWTVEEQWKGLKRAFSPVNTLLLHILFWPCPVPDHCTLSCLIEIHFWLFSWVRGIWLYSVCMCVYRVLSASHWRWCNRSQGSVHLGSHQLERQDMWVRVLVCVITSEHQTGLASE